MCVYVCLPLNHVRLFATPWTVALQTPLFMGILQARILECIAKPFSRRSSRRRDWTWVSCTAVRVFTDWATREAWNIWDILKIYSFIWNSHLTRRTVFLFAKFGKGRGTRDQIANIHWIIEKAREFQKNIYLCFIHYVKAFDCVDHNKLWKILQEMGIPDYLTCLLRNLYAGQKATVRTRHGTTDWFQIGKEVCQGCILSPCLFNL